MMKPSLTLVAVMLFLLSPIYLIAGYGVYTGFETTGVEGIMIHMEQPNTLIGMILIAIGIIHLGAGIVDCMFQLSCRKSMKAGELREQGVDV